MGRQSRTIYYHSCQIFAVVAQKQRRSPGCTLVKHGSAERAAGVTDWARTDPCRQRPPSLSLASGALRPLSLQHLISPLNLRLTRSFGSKGLPLCLQPSSTNGAWRGIEGRWRVAAVSAVVRWKNQPRGEKREPREVNRAARGLRNRVASCVEVRARGWEPLFIAGRCCWLCHVPLIAFLSLFFFSF